MIIILLPALVLMFLVGWCLYCLGDEKRPNKIQPKPPEKDNVTIMPMIYEEKQEITNE
jgi:hypothetical protein